MYFFRISKLFVRKPNAYTNLVKGGTGDQQSLGKVLFVQLF